MRKNLIINFHVVKDPAWFETVVLLLKDWYSLVDISYFEDPNNYKKRASCNITFDDGDKTFYTVAYPILKKHNIPATLFVSPKIIVEQKNFWFQEIRNYDRNKMIYIISKELSIPLRELIRIDYESVLKCLSLKRINKIIWLYQKETKTPPKSCQNMTLDEIIEVERSGLITIGAHTLNHPILKNETDECSYEEITQSVTELGKLLGHKVKFFAYPNGNPKYDFGAREIEYLRLNNISVAVSLQPKFISPNDNNLAFPRFGLTYGSINFIKVKLILGSNWEKLKSLFIYSKANNRERLLRLTS